MQSASYQTAKLVSIATKRWKKSCDVQDLRSFSSDEVVSKRFNKRCRPFAKENQLKGKIRVIEVLVRY